jgi:ABC-type lipoprotein release transport system permease subunit
MALGAQPARIVGLFSREALLLSGTGLVLGLCAYAAAAVWIRRILYQLRPWEPAVVVTVVFLVGLIGLIATAPAAIRAARTDPGSALRAD